MPDNVYMNNVYSYKKQMWHNKGIVGQVGETAKQVYGRMTPVVFEKRPFSIPLNGSIIESGDYGIVKLGNPEVQIGETKDRYALIQPEDYCAMFDEALPGINVETLGFLGQNAEKMFLTWVLPEIDVHGDPIEMYGMLTTGFDGIYGEHLNIATVRLVCQNTWNAAVSEAQATNNQGRGSLYSGKHNHPNHLKTLQSWMSHIQKDAEERVQIIKSLFCKMEATPVNDDLAYQLFGQVYEVNKAVPEFYPDDLRPAKQAKVDDDNRKAKESQDLAMSLFQGAGMGIEKNAYGWFNSVTELENHHRPSKKDATVSILLGNRQSVMSKAFAIANECVDAQ